MADAVTGWRTTLVALGSSLTGDVRWLIASLAERAELANRAMLGESR